MGPRRLRPRPTDRVENPRGGPNREGDPAAGIAGAPAPGPALPEEAEVRGGYGERGRGPARGGTAVDGRGVRANPAGLPPDRASDERGGVLLPAVPGELSEGGGPRMPRPHAGLLTVPETFNYHGGERRAMGLSFLPAALLLAVLVFAPLASADRRRAGGGPYFPPGPAGGAARLGGGP